MARRRGTPRAPRGFTLIEILVAMVLGAVLLILAAQVFRAALNSRERLRVHSGEVAALRRTYETISRDLHSAVVPPDDSAVQFGLAANPAGPGTDALQIASVVGEPLFAGRPANETVLVQYAIAQDPRTERPTLWRYAVPYPIPESTNAADSQEARAMALLPGVTAAAYTFYSATQQTWVQTWEGETGLPTAIRIDLSLEPADGRGEPTLQSWVFSLPAARFANDEASEAAATETATQ